MRLSGSDMKQPLGSDSGINLVPDVARWTSLWPWAPLVLHTTCCPKTSLVPRKATPPAALENRGFAQVPWS